MAKKLTPSQIADKQIKRATAAVEDYKEGVRNVSVSPTAEAAKAVDKYKAGVMEAAENGAYVDGLNAVGKADWIEATVTKGGDRYAKGVQAARAKIEDFNTQFGPIRDRVAEQVHAMPSDTFEDRLARAEANMRGLHEFKYKKTRKR